ncbi:MAG: HAMP domain-containing sensor histidine kinase [Gammaproteobacteria bacterium]
MGLVVFGFALVALPLIVSIVRAVAYVDALVLQSEHLVLQGIEVTRSSEMLAEQLSDMERNARQYQVLGDSALLALYQEKHTQFLTRVNLLEKLAPEGATPEQFQKLRHDSTAVLDALRLQQGKTGKIPPLATPEQANEVLEYFTTLKDLAVGLAGQSSRVISRDMRDLFKGASKARRHLYWQAATLIPLALVLVLLFTVLITKPIRQLSHAIQMLGETRFDQPVTVSGPPELRKLGEELDWLRQRLQEAEEEKNQFLRHMSHELKTPLASVREGAELLADGTVGALSESQNEVAAILRESSVELELLIENLLNFNAWREKRAHLQLDRFALLPMLAEIAGKHRLAVSAKHLEVRLPRTDAALVADRVLLATALENLFSNAFKFAPEGGEVRVLAKQTKRAWIIEVIDNGPGIPDVYKERIFEPFFRGHSPTGTRLRGTGVGLSVARECIQAHGGTIEVIDNDQQGANFRITLPKRPRSASVEVKREPDSIV